MKLPAVAIVACFACGIALGLHSPAYGMGTSRPTLGTAFAATLLLILAGFLLLRANRLVWAASASGLTWIFVGAVAAWSADQPRASEHVTSRVERGEVRLKTPLRWHGVLRDEPAKLRWGFGYEIELRGVDYENSFVPLAGGLRLIFSAPAGEVSPEVHAGDSVTIVAQAKLPPVFRDEGAFDRRAYLASQHVDMVATLRSAELIEIVERAAGPETWLPRIRRRLRDETDVLFASSPSVAATMRAMLLGDRSFVERDEAEAFQKTGTFHILVVAGLHVGAIAFALFWIGRRLRMNVLWTSASTLALLLAYVAVVEQRPPVLRAAIMAAVIVVGGAFFRRLELLNSAAVAAFLLLLARPLELRDPSFQLSFLAIGCIAGLAAPWLERTAQPYTRAVRGWRDVTRDAAHPPRATQFRIDLRHAAAWLATRVPGQMAMPLQNSLASGISLSLRALELLVVTLVLQLGMLPLLARDFHRVTLSGPVVNLLAVPLTGILVPLGFVTLTAGLIAPPIGKVLGLAISWIAQPFLEFVQWFADLPRWSYRIPGPPQLLVLVFLVSAASIIVTFRFNRRRAHWMRLGFAGILMASAVVIASYPFSPTLQMGKLEATVLDVGQGDSVLVVSPHGHTLLIDGGGAFTGFPSRSERSGADPGEEAVSPYLWSRGFQRLDIVALTHAHQDHIGGLKAVIENFRIGKLWIGREVPSASLANLEDLARRKGIAIEHESRAKAFSWDGATGEFLWPETTAASEDLTAANNDSLVLRLSFGSQRILLPGDAEEQAERAILRENSAEAMHADVLKIGHHGGRNSSVPDFLAAVRPSLAIISAGADNPYGHPSPEVLQRLESAGVRVLRTDRDGAVHVTTDGQTIEASCFVACAASALSAERQVHVSSGEENPKQQ